MRLRKNQLSPHRHSKRSPRALVLTSLKAETRRTRVDFVVQR